MEVANKRAVQTAKHAKHTKESQYSQVLVMDSWLPVEFDANLHPSIPQFLRFRAFRG